MSHLIKIYAVCKFSYFRLLVLKVISVFHMSKLSSSQRLSHRMCFHTEQNIAKEISDKDSVSNTLYQKKFSAVFTRQG